VYFSVLIWFPFILIFSILPPNTLIKQDLIYYEAYDFMSTAVFWLTPIVSAVAAVLPTIMWR